MRTYTTEGFHYITAITKPQIETLINNGVIQMDLFDQGLAEVKSDSIRYILRRNPQRAQEIRKSREDKLESLWVTVTGNSREVVLSIDKEVLKEEAKLDGCYVIKSDLSEQSATAETIHGRLTVFVIVNCFF
ncbi:MAG: hypothetical protein HQK97_00620 [Nitrospirae bacterium]|nr:hypothetical protein [Nitrospirota bacterium]